MTRSVLHKGTRLAVLVLLAGCIETPAIVGNAPENPTRELPHDETDPAKTAAARAEKLRRHENEADLAGPRVEDVDPKLQRIGVATTHEFHRPECRLLTGVPTAEQVRFVSPWDALDGGYRPCEVCNPMR